MPRTFRDRKETSYAAARFAKERFRGDIIEIMDRATGKKSLMMEDGRTG